MFIAVRIAEESILAFGVVLLLFQFAAHEFGYRIGVLRGRRSEGNPESVAVVVGGMLALLAFVLALTLSFANSRFNERRLGALEEANAIGTAWLRAKAVGGVHGEEIASLLERYTQVRIDFVNTSQDATQIDAMNRETNTLQTRIWGHLTRIVRDAPTPVAASLMASLNQTFDMSATERFAFEVRLPQQVFWLLMFMTIICMGCLGYQFGLREKPSRVMVAILMTMWTASVVDILDLGSGRLGNLRIPATVYEWTQQGFRGGIPLPPQ